MPCHAPLRGWQTDSGVSLGREPQDARPIALPCGKCLGCSLAGARSWAIRCQLENSQHDHAAVTTLTYSNDNLPPTLNKRHLSGFLKRLRRRTTDRTIRFFASGEYGERTNRPHYHALLFGIHHQHDAGRIEETWGLGHTRTDAISPQAIAYVAGYVAKKIGFRDRPKYRRVPEGTPDAQQRVDPRTGEVYYTITTYQPTFLQMSRNPGIGSHARQWPESWRSHAVHNGHQVPVPRYLHDAWTAQATQDDIEQLEWEKELFARRYNITDYNRQALARIAQAQQEMKSQRHKL